MKKILFPALSIAMVASFGQSIAKESDINESDINDGMRNMSRSFVVRANLSYISRYTMASKLNISFNPVPTTGTNPEIPENPTYNLKTALTGSVSAAYFLSPSFAIQLAATLPANITQTFTTSTDPAPVPPALQVGVVSKIKYQQTSAALQYYKSMSDEPVMIYVGVGAAYNHLKGTLMSGVTGVTNLELKNKVSPFVQIGFDYYFSDSISLNASLSFTKFKINETSTVTNLPDGDDAAVPLTSKATNRYSVSPMIASLGFGLRF